MTITMFAVITYMLCGISLIASIEFPPMKTVWHKAGAMLIICLFWLPLMIARIVYEQTGGE